MGEGSAPLPFIAREGQPALHGRVWVMMIFLACHRDWSSRAVAEKRERDAHVQSTATRQPRPRTLGARGVWNLTLGFTASQARAHPWALGQLSAFQERQGPRLAYPRPTYKWLSQQPCRPIFINKASKTSRGSKLRGRRNHEDLLGSRPSCRLTRSGDIKPRQNLMTLRVTEP